MKSLILALAILTTGDALACSYDTECGYGNKCVLPRNSYSGGVCIEFQQKPYQQQIIGAKSINFNPGGSARQDGRGGYQVQLQQYGR